MWNKPYHPKFVTYIYVFKDDNYLIIVTNAKQHMILLVLCIKLIQLVNDNDLYCCQKSVYIWMGT